MKIIGYWIRSLSDDDFPPPQELITDCDASTRNAIAEYLDAGLEFAAYRGVSWCRFFCDHPMGNRELTDGEWVWPEGLSHYVRDHNVRLPDEFVASVRLQSRPALPEPIRYLKIPMNRSGKHGALQIGPIRSDHD